MAKIIEVIITSDTIGSGTEGNPIRKIYQLFTKDGELICEYDGFLGEATVEETQLIRLARGDKRAL